MFIVMLKFSDNKEQVPQFMEAHKAWLNQGFSDGVFVLAGTLQPNLGGGVMAINCSREELEVRVSEDPFVAENVVTAEIIEITPSMTSEQLAFLKG